MIVNQLPPSALSDTRREAARQALAGWWEALPPRLLVRHGRLERIVLPAALIALAPLLVYASNGLTPLLAVLALFYLLRLPDSLPGLLRARQRRWWLPLGLLLSWTALSAFWSLRPLDDLLSSLRLALTMAIGLLVVRGICLTPPESARRVAVFLPAAVLLTACLAAAEMLLDFPITRRMLAQPPDFNGPDFLFLNNIAHGMPVMLLLLWPAVYVLAAIRGARAMALVLVLLAAAVILALPMGATKLALFLSAAIGLLALWRPKLAILAATTGAFAAAALLAALLVLTPEGEVASTAAGHLPDSWTHRLQIWRYAADHIAEQPVLGYGFDASRRIGGELVTASRQVPLVTGNGGQRLPLHPHSAPLQIWLELGAVGMAIGLLLLAGLLALLWRMAGDRPAAAMALATLSAWGVVASLSFGIWQTWWLCAAWFSIAAVLLARRTVADRAVGGAVAGRAPGQAPVAEVARVARASGSAS